MAELGVTVDDASLPCAGCGAPCRFGGKRCEHCGRRLVARDLRAIERRAASTDARIARWLRWISVGVVVVGIAASARLVWSGILFLSSRGPLNRTIEEAQAGPEFMRWGGLCALALVACVATLRWRGPGLAVAICTWFVMLALSVRDLAIVATPPGRAFSVAAQVLVGVAGARAGLAALLLWRLARGRRAMPTAQLRSR